MYAVSFAFDFHSSECPAPLCAPPYRNIAENCTTVCHLVRRLEIPLLRLLQRMGMGMGMVKEIDLAQESERERGSYATLLLAPAICIKPNHLFVYFIVAHIFR